MRNAKLIEVPDGEALQTVGMLLHKHTKQGKAGVVTLMYTGQRLQDVLELEALTTHPHYGICGFLGASLDLKAESVRLLAGGHTEIGLDLYYQWGVLSLYLRQATSSQKGTMSAMCSPPHRGWLLQGFDGVLPILGLGQLVSGPVPGGGKLTVTSYENDERIHFLFPAEQASQVDEISRMLIANLDPPSKVHVILTGDLKTVRELHESKQVVSCGNCCAWHLGYSNVLAKESDVDVGRLDEIAQFLAKRLGRERALIFGGFTWSWEESNHPPASNSLVWKVPKRRLGHIEVNWYNPLPHGALKLLERDARQFLFRAKSINGS